MAGKQNLNLAAFLVSISNTQLGKTAWFVIVSCGMYIFVCVFISSYSVKQWFLVFL